MKDHACISGYAYFEYSRVLRFVSSFDSPLLSYSIFIFEHQLKSGKIYLRDIQTKRSKIKFAMAKNKEKQTNYSTHDITKKKLKSKQYDLWCCLCYFKSVKQFNSIGHICEHGTG